MSAFKQHYFTCGVGTLEQVSPTPRPRTSTGPWPVRNWAAHQEVSGGRASEASSVFTATPHRLHYHLSSASCQHYGELYNYFVIYYNVIIIEIKCIINVMHLNHPKTIPPPPRSMENCLPWNWSPVPKRLGTVALEHSQFLPLTPYNIAEIQYISLIHKL